MITKFEENNRKRDTKGFYKEINTQKRAPARNKFYTIGKGHNLLPTNHTWKNYFEKLLIRTSEHNPVSHKYHTADHNIDPPTMEETSKLKHNKARG